MKSFNESEIIIAEHKNEIVGFAGKEGNLISFLNVKQGFYNKNIGSTLLKEILKTTDGKPYLFVAKNNTKARNLYKKFGFELVEEFKFIYNGEKIMVHKLGLNL